MKETVFTGSACAIITPFDETGKVDLKALKRQIDFHAQREGTQAGDKICRQIRSGQSSRDCRYGQ